MVKPDWARVECTQKLSGHLILKIRKRKLNFLGQEMKTEALQNLTN